MTQSDILDQYVSGVPDDQKVLDLFKEEWSSAMPASHAGLEAGHAALFEDGRLSWGLEQLDGVQGRRILELGPLEGGHSYMLEQAGAESILAIEANARAYLKCLVIKEVMGLARCRFKLGDFSDYLRTGTDRFDLVVASGVLYHMRQPLELLAQLARTSDRVFLWTHYYDPQIIGKNPQLIAKFVEGERQEQGGYGCYVHKQFYQAALGWQGFCGGSAPHSYWMPREDILSALKHYGFNDVRVGFEQLDHPSGPAFCLAAQRSNL